MKKNSKSKAVPKVDPYIDGLMAKLLERLINLERKMDSLISHVSRIASAGVNAPKNIQVPQIMSQAPRHERMMYEAICADCNKVCEVPFKPTEERAVYCKTCWAVRKGGASSRPGMPVLRPVALSPKPASQLGLTVPASPADRQQASAVAQAASQAKETPKKTKKRTSEKKSKKKKR